MAERESCCCFDFPQEEQSGDGVSVEVTSFAASHFRLVSLPPVTVYRKLLVLPSLLLALSSATVPIDKLRVLCICTLGTLGHNARPSFTDGTVGTNTFEDTFSMQKTGGDY